MARACLRGNESPKKRLKVLLHSGFGAYYAVLLRNCGVDHIHVHHGYFGSWIAMTAAALLDISYSMTLHGSDLLLNAAYLDTKLEHCRFCATVSEYNRGYILKHFPAIDSEKITVSRLGVEISAELKSPRCIVRNTTSPLILVSVGRLHPVKNHGFLISACAQLRDNGIDFKCAIAGEGSERRRLESLIRSKSLQDYVTLLGHVDRSRMDEHYSNADVIVLTSRSEGIPLVLMEAMAKGKIVLAPEITGIPELVIPGKTGFLYTPDMIDDFLKKISFIYELVRGQHAAEISRLDWIRHAARVQILHNFNRSKNLAHFSNYFLQSIATC
jgi:colanic acid/amylovoran biosynthesis glycosyltransferase